MGAQKGRRIKTKQKKAQILFKEIMAENISNLGSDLDIQVYEAHKFPPNFLFKIIAPKHIIIKLSKTKDKENF